MSFFFFLLGKEKDERIRLGDMVKLCWRLEFSALLLMSQRCHIER